MKERPILFHPDMVRALLDGRKTQTRRTVKWSRQTLKGGHCRGLLSADGYPTVTDAKTATEPWSAKSLGWLDCPYGQPGDRLWVREACQWFDVPNEGFTAGWGYKADIDHCGQVPVGGVHRNVKGPWKKSIHMPRAASRITLEVTGIRVERLQDISINDAIEEGVEIVNYTRLVSNVQYPIFKNYLRKKQGSCGLDFLADPVSSFRSLINAINGPETWDSNPWVWVVEFKVLGNA